MKKIIIMAFAALFTAGAFAQDAKTTAPKPAGTVTQTSATPSPQAAVGGRHHRHHRHHHHRHHHEHRNHVK